MGGKERELSKKSLLVMCLMFWGSQRGGRKSLLRQPFKDESDVG
jgi:hypothetical protein